MSDLLRVSKYPYSLRTAVQGTRETEQRFYGTQTSLRISRKRAEGTKRQRFSVLRALKQLGL
ncbi:MAG: hypothetical protein Q7U76_12550 [Nitrospirota bacterium]|nr:hypothetical protein [Nitrospirota bacterium]